MPILKEGPARPGGSIEVTPCVPYRRLSNDTHNKNQKGITMRIPKIAQTLEPDRVGVTQASGGLARFAPQMASSDRSNSALESYTSQHAALSLAALPQAHGENPSDLARVDRHRPRTPGVECGPRRPGT